MNTSGAVADEIVKVSLEGVEVVAKLTGTGAKQVAKMIYEMIRDNQLESAGKKSLVNMLKSGKELKIFTLKGNQLNKFMQEAKRYGISYCTLADKKENTADGIVDLLVKSEDASRVNRIVERFNLLIQDKPQTEEKVEDGVSKDFLEKENQSETSSMNKGDLGDDKKESVRANLKEIKEKIKVSGEKTEQKELIKKETKILEK